MFHRRRPPLVLPRRNPSEAPSGNPGHRAPRRGARFRRWVAALGAVLLLPLALLAALAAPAHAAGTLTATFTSQDNGSWWKGTYVVRNSGAATVSGWTLEFDLPAGVSVTGHYNGDATVSGRHVTVKNAFYNAGVPAGGSTEPYSYWFIANGPLTAPTGCTVNGDKCDGTPDVPPTAPGAPKATAVTAHSVALSWAAAQGGDHPVASYEVLGGPAPVTTTTGTTATVSGLAPATSYTFTVRAKDTRGNAGPASAPVTVKTVDPATDPAPPTAPGRLRATGKTSSGVGLAWDKSTDNVAVAAYDVYRGGTLAKTVGADATTATVDGLSPATAYTFTVKARDTADNSSPASNALTVTTDDVAGPGRQLKVGYFAQ